MTDPTTNPPLGTEPQEDLVLLGRKLGTYRTWSEVDGNEGSTSFNEFEALPEFTELSFDGTVDLMFTMTTGEIDIVDADGNILITVDAITLLANTPKSE